MYQIDGVIEGVADILLNRMVDPSVLDSGVSGGTQGKDARLAEAEKKVYRVSDGSVGVSQWQLKRTILDGCAALKMKVGKTSLYKLVDAFVFLDGDPTFGVEERDYIHEVTGKIPPKRGAAAIIRRPALRAGWRLRFRLNVANDGIPDEQLRAVFATAGSLIGMGSWRPNYGRFFVAEWNVIRDDASKPVPSKKKKDKAA